MTKISNLKSVKIETLQGILKELGGVLEQQQTTDRVEHTTIELLGEYATYTITIKEWDNIKIEVVKIYD